MTNTKKEIMGYDLRQISSVCPEQWVVSRDDRDLALIHVRSSRVTVYAGADEDIERTTAWKLYDGEHEGQFRDEDRDQQLWFCMGIIYRHLTTDKYDAGSLAVLDLEPRIRRPLYAYMPTDEDSDAP